MITSAINFLLVSALQFFLFIPKILHVMQEKRDGGSPNAVVVTGLNSNNEEEVGLYTQSGVRRSTGTGELILTTKSQKELLQEIMELQDRLKTTLQQYTKLQEENDDLKAKLRNGGVGTIQETDEEDEEPKGDATAETTETHDEVGRS
ncbi:MAG: hypothetical protein SGARI_007976 [Bacillariaceae sp.]